MNPVVIILARMASSRQPGKAMRPILGEPMLGHIIERCRASHVGEVVVATTQEHEDLEIVEFQSTGEGRSFLRDEALAILDLGLHGCQHLMAAQSEILG